MALVDLFGVGMIYYKCLAPSQKELFLSWRLWKALDLPLVYGRHMVFLALGGTPGFGGEFV